MNKEKINLVWLKRDLRLHDNEAISRAIKNGKRFLIFYAFEKILGRPLTQKTQEGFFRIGLFLLFSLMFFTTFNDLKDIGLF